MPFKITLSVNCTNIQSGEYNFTLPSICAPISYPLKLQCWCPIYCLPFPTPTILFDANIYFSESKNYISCALSASLLWLWIFHKWVQSLGNGFSLFDLFHLVYPNQNPSFWSKRLYCKYLKELSCRLYNFIAFFLYQRFSKRWMELKRSKLWMKKKIKDITNKSIC